MIRSVNKKDFPQIKEIAMKGWTATYTYLSPNDLNRLVNEYYSDRNLKKSMDRVKTGKGLFIVAETGKKIIGFSHVAIHGDEGELVRIYMDLEHEGKGIGTKLLIDCETFLRRKGCRKYFAYIHKDNKRGLNFYLKNGFIHVKKRDKEDEFKNGKILLYLEKSF